MLGYKHLIVSASVVAVYGVAGVHAQAQVDLAPLVTDLEVAIERETFETDARRRAGIAAVPSGFGLSNGAVSATLSGSYGPERGGPTNTRYDASTALAAGFGDPAHGLAIEFGVVNTSFRDFGASGFFTVGVSRQFSFDGGIGSFALNASNLEGWGDSRNNDESASATASVVYSINGRPVMATFGVGSNVTRDQEMGLIAGFGVSLAPDWALSAGFVGDSPIVGASYFPAALDGASVNFSLRDLDLGNDAVFGVDLGYSFNLFGR